MRIGIITGEYPPLQGGISTQCSILAEKLTGSGHQVFIFSRLGTEQTRTDVPIENNTRSWNWGTINKIQSWIEQNQLDIVHLHYQTAAFDMSPWIHFIPQRIRNVPTITTFHDLRFPYMFPKAGRLRNWIVNHLAQTSDGIVLTNYEDYSVMRDLTPNTVIPIGSNILSISNPEEIANFREQLAPGDELVLAHFGFVNHSKGVETLFKSLAVLRDRGIPAKLVMVGGKTGSSDPTNAVYIREIETLAQNLNIEDKIQWTGFVTPDQVSLYLQSADLVVLPFRDGASFRRSSLTSAIHLECPIVTTIPQVETPEFEDGVNIRLVPADNPTALVDTLEELYTSPELRQTLQSGVISLKQFLSWDSIIQEHIRFYNEVTKQRKSSSA